MGDGPKGSSSTRRETCTGRPGGGFQSGCSGNGCGVVFKLGAHGKETVLHTFCTQSNCADGASPYAGLVVDQKGNLFGTTSTGGVQNNICADEGDALTCGVVFKISPAPCPQKWKRVGSRTAEFQV